MTDSVLTARDAPTRITPKVTPKVAPKVSWRRAAVVLRRLYRAYWDYRLRRATIVVLQKLDDRTLADLGIDRHEIESAVYDRTRDRQRRYGWL
jgi:uncharacterized protein YjiS (DUF1127 family)